MRYAVSYFSDKWWQCKPFFFVKRTLQIYLFLLTIKLLYMYMLLSNGAFMALIFIPSSACCFFTSSSPSSRNHNLFFFFVFEGCLGLVISEIILYSTVTLYSNNICVFVEIIFFIYLLHCIYERSCREFFFLDYFLLI